MRQRSTSRSRKPVAFRKPDLRLLAEACTLAESACQTEAHDAARLARKLGVSCSKELAALAKDANARARKFDAMRGKIAEMIGEP